MEQDYICSGCCYHYRIFSLQESLYWRLLPLSYNLVKEVGDGTFGNVWRAVNKQTGEFDLEVFYGQVAIKKMKKKYYSWEECVNLREVKFFLHQCPKYSYCSYSRAGVQSLPAYDRPKLFAESDIRNWCFQVFQGLFYMHEHGYFHRDLKPENLLVSKDVIKIADLGLAREIDSNMWAMGAILAELLSLRPLFPGARYLSNGDHVQFFLIKQRCECDNISFNVRSEADEIYKVCNVIGSPTQETWLEGLNLASVINYQFPQAINLVERLCSWDPNNRLTAAEALQHPFFQSCYYVPPSLRTKTSVGQRRSLEHQQQQSVKRLPATLTNTANNKPFNSYANAKANGPPFGACQTQRNLETAWNNKAMGSYHVRDAKYIPPPGRKSPCK
ncbi:hypothetical protein BRARA_B02835 [Brassica rapa]|uniref:Protein kinase domain-containing protein n=1 Tax=Brassica campestris TaxID=3711 RepID=A0A398AKD7_BRACM|nr:hypothetical protein BRARA_B02835 [Brassica rapa]